jgi:transcriptional regulator with XRE-family HTH domain
LTRTETGDRIKRLRAGRGWTQRQLADRAQVDPQTVSRVERGVHALPVTITKLTNAMREEEEDAAVAAAG